MAEFDRTAVRQMLDDVTRKMQGLYAAPEDVLFEARVENAEGRTVLVVCYKLSTDGRVECFEMLDEALWPHLSPMEGETC
jgi:hypothetical protein